MRHILAASATILLFASNAQAAEKVTRFWNLTSKTVMSLQLAPSGTEQFGDDLCKLDKDGSVDHDERLKITTLASGRYDA